MANRAVVALAFVTVTACAEEPDVLLVVERASDDVRVRLSVCRDQNTPLDCSDEGTVFGENDSARSREVGLRIDDAFADETFRLLLVQDGATSRCDYTAISIIRAPFESTVSVGAAGEAPSFSCEAANDCGEVLPCP